MKKFLRRVTAIFIVVILVLATLFVFWASDAAPASDVALQALNSDSQTFVTIENGWATFYPANNQQSETGFIFYPGGKVDYRAYAPLMNMIADEGYFVVVMPVPLNLAMFDINVAARIQAEYPEIKNWFVGGHSLGGVAAASYGGSHPDIKGVVLWASNSADDSLKINNMPTLLVYGTQDGLFPLEMVEDARALLPEDTIYVAIDGGNHAQFGSYGLQAGDYTATISPLEQWTQTVDATVEFMQNTLSVSP
ncbi:MAG: alpha/beta hydrolase [Anaerolineales bacterium]|nr:alpha/beta hydrolase [Anaerolineales bacterium]MBX3037594.1 alpha/beta hydrolase [Anaerolineales bacterium]